MNSSSQKFEGMAVVGQQVMTGEYFNHDSRQVTEGSSRDGERRLEDQYEKYKQFELNQRKKYNESLEQSKKSESHTNSKQELLPEVE